MNSAASLSQVTAGRYLDDSTRTLNYIVPTNFATSRFQIAAGTYLQSYSVSITNYFIKILRVPLIIYDP